MAVADESFRETLEQLGVRSRRTGLRRPRELGRRAALAAASDAIWRRTLGPLLTRDAVQEILRVKSRQGIHDLIKRGRILALPTTSGTYEFPAFQFDVASGRVYGVVPHALAELRRAFDDDAYSAASWFVSPQDLLDARTPAEWMREGGPDAPVVEEARRAAALLEQ